MKKIKLIWFPSCACGSKSNSSNDFTGVIISCSWIPRLVHIRSHKARKFKSLDVTVQTCSINAIAMLKFNHIPGAPVLPDQIVWTGHDDICSVDGPETPQRLRIIC